MKKLLIVTAFIIMFGIFFTAAGLSGPKSAQTPFSVYAEEDPVLDPYIPDKVETIDIEEEKINLIEVPVTKMSPGSIIAVSVTASAAGALGIGLLVFYFAVYKKAKA